MSSDLYRGFARRNYLFDKPGADIVKFFRDLFAHNDVRTVLDCACGAGYELLIFDQLGCRAVGSDISDEMLELARENRAEADATVPLPLQMRLPQPEHSFLVATSRVYARDDIPGRVHGVLHRAEYDFRECN